MTFNRPPSESQPRPSVVDLRARPRKAVDVLRATDTEPESGLMFDPKRDIGPETGKKMFLSLDVLRHTNQWLRFLPFARSLSILFTNHDSDFKLDGKERDSIKRALKTAVKKFDWFSYLRAVAGASVLYPDHKKELGLHYVTTGEICAGFMEYSLSNSFDDFLIMRLMGLSILDPDFRKKQSNDAYTYKILKEDFDFLKRDKNWLDLIRVCEVICLLFPQHKQDLKLSENITQDIINDELGFWREHSNWSIFSDVCVSLMILSAKQAEIGDDGKISFVYDPKPLLRPRIKLPIISKV